MPRPTIKSSIDDILAYNPCAIYTRNKLEELFAGRQSMSMDEILAVNIPDEHKLDCILRLGLVPTNIDNQFRIYLTSTIPKYEINPRSGSDKEFKNNQLNKLKLHATTTAEMCVILQKINISPDMNNSDKMFIVSAIATTQLNYLLGLFI